MRAKLKAKEDEVALLKSDAADRQKTLDSLAMQLRDLQKSHSHGRSRCRKEEERRRLSTSSRLEKNMTEIRAASVVLEVTNDAAAVDQIAYLLTDSIGALRDDMDSLASYGNDTASLSSRSSIPLDVRRIRKELDDRTKAVARLEDELRRHREEAAHLLTQTNGRNEEVEYLRFEVLQLRDQCQTNMEVLAQKSRELSLLRDSLKVDDGVGYISDDGTDASETETVPSSFPAHLHLGMPPYGPSQAEAIATLLGHGRHTADIITVSPSHDELETLKREVFQARTDGERTRKQLRTEKESLANAKMIISSLEKANKSMMEDLRARLQDSNTAIASLLEKSMESEKTTSKLRAEVEALRREKDKEKQRYAMSSHRTEEKKDDSTTLIRVTELID
jgi:chromosome segregation ATPase